MASSRRLRVESVVMQRLHDYMDNWTPAIGDIFEVEIDEVNLHNRYAVAVKVDGAIVGHVPQEVSKIVLLMSLLLSGVEIRDKGRN